MTELETTDVLLENDVKIFTRIDINRSDETRRLLLLVVCFILVSLAFIKTVHR